jgi:hypothetical protein
MHINTSMQQLFYNPSQFYQAADFMLDRLA